MKHLISIMEINQWQIFVLPTENDGFKLHYLIFDCVMRINESRSKNVIKLSAKM